jgi:hypothetical protein
LAVSFLDANTGTLVGSNGEILRTDDGGATWRDQASGTINRLYAVAMLDANTGIAVGQFVTILRTADFSLSEAKSTVDRDVTTFVLQAGGGLRRAFECGLW